MGLFRDIDDLLRGQAYRDEDLSRGKIDLPLSRLIISGTVLGLIYGACMGLYSALHHEGEAGGLQIISSALKVPLLFFLTLLVTYPSLYVFATLAGSRLGFLDTLKLLAGGIAVNLALLASLGPVTAFFTFNTSSYPFLIILNVAFFTLSGLVGLGFLWKMLGKVFTPDLPAPAAPEETDEGVEKKPSTPPPASGRAHFIFYIWMLIYGSIGAQMGWLLRPFIGRPDLPFQVFRPREGSFFESILDTLRTLTSG